MKFHDCSKCSISLMHILFSVLYNIMANEYVSEGYKDRLRVAARTGRNEGVCHVSRDTVSGLRNKKNTKLYSPGLRVFVAGGARQQQLIMILSQREREEIKSSPCAILTVNVQ